MCDVPEFIKGMPAIAAFANDTPKALYHRVSRYGEKAMPGLRKEGGTYKLHTPTYRAAYAPERAA
jgi:hypothetical protein